MKKSASKRPVPSVSPSAISDLDWNDEIEEEVKVTDLGSLVVYSRDWTVETIFNQISQGNIDLNPKFQRRNAWNDDRRSRLIESLVVGLPVPEVVLAEHPTRPKSFIVIDGKQRLLTIAGFINPSSFSYWTKPRLKELRLRPELQGRTFDQLSTDFQFSDDLRKLHNADLRCTIIGNVKSRDVLYDVFYRLNTGSVPLSTQELRQVLHKGPFADYLIEVTDSQHPIHKVLGLSEPDARLRDAEIVLRFIALLLFADTYKGSLKAFLDSTMETVTADWDEYKTKVQRANEELCTAIENIEKVLGVGFIGKKYVEGQWEGRFNRVLFEVQAFYLRLLTSKQIAAGKNKFLTGFKKLCSDSREFRSAIESTTKTNERYEVRFRLFRDLVNAAFGTSIRAIPVK